MLQRAIPSNQAFRVENGGDASSVLTFSFQRGSRAEAIAQLVALKLGFQYYDWEIVSRAAAEAGVSQETIVESERWPGLGERFVAALALGHADNEFDPIGAVSATAPTWAMARFYYPYVEQAILNLAAAGGCVLGGHHAAPVLRERLPGAFNVLVQGSCAERVKHVALAENLAESEALRCVSLSDRETREFGKHVYHVNWLDAGLYDIALSSDGLSIDVASDMVVAPFLARAKVRIA